MWPYPETEAKWLRAEISGYRIERCPEFPPEVLDYYIRRGREVRAEAAFDTFPEIAAGFRRLVKWARYRNMVENRRGVSTS